MKVEYLYNNKHDTSTFYLWKDMELIDKFIYEGRMSAEEVKKIKKELLDKKSTS